MTAGSGDSRQYPVRPVASAAGVVIDGDRVLLVQRKFEPLAGHWTLPGGAIELGEPVADAVAREVREETGLEVEVGPVVEVLDRIYRDADGRVQFHYVLIDCLCRPRGGTVRAGSDAAAVEWVAAGNLGAYEVPGHAIPVIRRAFAMNESAWRR
ncbi:MAG TPA: NUDIX hydrolase [Vicinamibacterales bacterium]